MEIETRHNRQALVVDIAGRLDSSTAGAAHDRLVGIANSGAGKIVLNLGKVDFMTSAGLRALLTMAKLVQSARGEMRICSPSPAVRDVLTTSGFNSLIHIFDDETAAVESWN